MVLNVWVSIYSSLGVALSNQLKGDQQIRGTREDRPVPAGGLNSGPLAWRDTHYPVYVSVCMGVSDVCFLAGYQLMIINRSSHKLCIFCDQLKTAVTLM